MEELKDGQDSFAQGEQLKRELEAMTQQPKKTSEYYGAYHDKATELQATEAENLKAQGYSPEEVASIINNGYVMPEIHQRTAPSQAYLEHQAGTERGQDERRAA